MRWLSFQCAITAALSYVSVVFGIGEVCIRQQQCGSGEFCYQNICRRNSCKKQTDCQPDEMCLYGNVGFKYRDACFPFVPFGSKKLPSIPTITDDLCPGGGQQIILENGKLEQCDLNNACIRGICNPQNGVCCTKIRTCLSPARPLMNLIINKPIICKMFNENMIKCPEGTFCEERTGFCCGIESTTDPTMIRPKVGDKCQPEIGCRGNAACICELANHCTCQCPTELGYSLDTDGIHCKRARRRLREKCKSNAECQAAYSECTSGGCRCKSGFQRDKSGGCKPTAYRCANKLEPLRKGNGVRNCKLQFNRKKREGETTESENQEYLENVTRILQDDHQQFDAAALLAKEFIDDCPSQYYCVPTFDNPKTLTLQGFCCPLPSENRPVCPVGVAHESSSPPNYGCQNCPDDYFCHRDKIYTDKEICCPKPCTSVEDVFANGQCYPVAQLGESCQISDQCVTASANNDGSDTASAQCIHGICKCPSGFANIHGLCKKVMCTVGWKGEPSMDSKKQLIHCIKSSDCAVGYMCDLMFNVCCKGVNKCPKGSTEVSGSCTDHSCEQNGDFCHRPLKGKQRICCRHEVDLQ